MNFLTHECRISGRTDAAVRRGALGALAQDDGDVARTLLNPGGAPHGARAPAAEVLVGGLVDERRLDEQRVEIDAGALRSRVRDRALDDLLEDGCTARSRELEELESLTGLPPADEIDHHSGLT